MRTSIWQLGFRPFFLLGALHALCVIALWVGFLLGWVPRLGYFDPVLWHSHEMVYGFTVAIVGGFVLTAAQNWTGIPGVKGRPLQVAVLLWIFGRILVTLPSAPPLLAAVVDLSFLPYVSYLMIPYLKDPELKTERVFYLFFAILFAGNLLVHLQALGWWPGHARQGVYLGLDTVILITIFMGGRVIPFFTESTVARAQPKTWPAIEVASHVSAAVFLVTDFFVQETWLHAGVAFVAAAIHLIRLYGWQVRRVRRIPLVWVLHVGYLWLALGFLLSGLASFGWIARGTALHAFTVGGLGVIIFGMVSRVALGHTGRRLHPAFWTVVAYYALNLSAVFRVFGPWAAPGFAVGALSISAVLWVIAFLLYLIVYTPILMSPRADGRPG